MKMTRQKTERENIAIKKVALAGTASLLALLLLILIVTFFSTSRLAAQLHHRCHCRV